MYGAIAGDIIGSVHEHKSIKTKDFPLFHPQCRFTNDTVPTIAVADAILTGRPYGQSIQGMIRKWKTIANSPFAAGHHIVITSSRQGVRLSRNTPHSK